MAVREQSLRVCVVGTAYSGRLGGEDRNPIWRCFKAGGRQNRPGNLQLGRAKAAHVDTWLLSVSRWLGTNEESGAHCSTRTLLLGLPSDSRPFYCSSAVEDWVSGFAVPRNSCQLTLPATPPWDLILSPFCDICQVREVCRPLGSVLLSFPPPKRAVSGETDTVQAPLSLTNSLPSGHASQDPTVVPCAKSSR